MINVWDRGKASLNSHHDCQYLHVTTSFIKFNSFTTFSKAIFAIFQNNKPNLRQEHCTGN